MKRVSQHPVSATITRRRQLAQDMRNDLAAYRQLAIGGDLGSVHRDRLLRRLEERWHELLSLEGLEPQ